MEKRLTVDKVVTKAGGRKNKKVTLVFCNFSKIELSKLKSKLGCNGNIIPDGLQLQGDQKVRVIRYCEEQGIPVTP